jgi:hypothetical protein
MVGEAFDWEFAMNPSTYLQYYLFVNDIYPKWRFFFANYTLFATSCGSMISKCDRIHIW